MGLFKRSKEEIIEKANQQLLAGIRKNDIGRVANALQDGANVDAKVSEFKAMLRSDNGSYELLDVSGLMHSILKNKLGMAEFLLDNGANVNIKDGYGVTPLILLIIRDIKFLDNIMERKPNLNVADNGGVTALMYAAARGMTGTVELLLKNGADINILDRNGQSCIDYTHDNKIISLIRRYSQSERIEKQEKEINRKEAVEEIIGDLNKD